MESTAVTAPPEMLERVVLLLIPPAAREAVAGDLCETYRSPRQYASEALRTVPFVIFSQLRRNLNLPALLLQAMLVWFCLGQTAALAAAPLLLLAQAFQPLTRPTPRRAMREAILVAFATLIFLQAAWGHAHWSLSTDAIRFGLELFFVGPCLSPLLCLLRAGLIVSSDRRFGRSRAELSAQELADDHARFLRQARMIRLAESFGLIAAAILTFQFLGASSAGALLTLALLLGALCLLLNSPVLAEGDFRSLCARYRRDLIRRQQLRSFLSWLWFSPLLLALHQQMTVPDPHKISFALCGAGLLILFFFAAAFNHENRGCTQEQIKLLDQMREKLA